MIASLSATEVAFVMAGVMQGVLCIVWLLGGWVVTEERRPALQWAAYAGLSACSFALLVTGLRAPDPQRAELARAAGNLCGIVAMLALQRGIRLFTGRALRGGAHLIALAVVLAASWVGLDPAAGYIRVGVLSGEIGRAHV